MMLRTAMAAAADLGDWGAVSRLFNELAGSDNCAEALELVGSPAIIEDYRRRLLSSRDEELSALTRQDADALRLALRAYCSRGDALLAGKALRAMRELGCPLCASGYLSLLQLARSGSSGPLRSLGAGDVSLSLTSALEPRIFAARNAVASLARADQELVALVVLSGALVVAAGVALGAGELHGSFDALDQFP